jgi:hypothetical protein
VVLRQPVLCAELTLAEAAVAKHSLNGLLALVVLAADLLGSHLGDVDVGDDKLLGGWYDGCGGRCTIGGDK